MDLDGDGKISLDEMESYMKQVKLYMKDKKYDADTDKVGKSGTITNGHLLSKVSSTIFQALV